MKRIWPHLLVVFSLVAILLTGAPVALKNFLVDLRFNSFPRQASGDVVILAIILHPLKQSAFGRGRDACTQN